jgi:Cof subfamily protein (haloacid dehalogenase superfamily)
VPVPQLAAWAQRPDQVPVLKLMIIGRPAVLPDLADRLRQAAPGLEVTSSGEENLEVTAAGVTKGSGLMQLGARLQIPREAMLAFGDSRNDMEMLTYAGTGVAMGNASDAVKAAADRVAPTCDQEGVARIIEELCLS